MIAIVDYGAGNLRNVSKALSRFGAENQFVSDPGTLRQARGIVIPGVGAAASAMEALAQSGMADAIKDAVLEGKPVLGICLGYQLLYEWSAEGDVPCLGLFPGRVTKIVAEGLKVPHIGWDEIVVEGEHPILKGINSGEFFYFANSYCVSLAEESPDHVLGWTQYGERFVSVFADRNVIGVQFHPEKSGDRGLQFMSNFVDSVLS